MDTKKFSAARLCEAQSLKAISNADLALKVDVTTDMVSKWRRGISPPRTDNVTQLATVLDVPHAFFYRSEKTVNLDGKLLKRDKKSRSKKVDEAQKFFVEYFTEGMEKIFSSFNLAPSELPDFDIAAPKTLTKDDIEIIAMRLRRAWDLGGLPIRTLSNLLLSKGIIVQRVDMDWDGVSFIENGTPFILINDGQQKSRDITTIAHEFGHLVLHHTNPKFDPIGLTAKDKQMLEDQAFYFGSCFKMPRETYLRDVYGASYACLKQVKPKWQASIGSQIMHLYGLGVITKEEKASLFKAASWHQKTLKREPHEDLIVFEECDFLQDAVDRLVEDGEQITIDKAANLIPHSVAAKFQTKDSIIVEFPKLRTL